MIDFNTEPYNDDFDEDNKFYRILFRPSFAVQARELTQLQTILQQQIKRHGDAIFKQGAMVIPGQASVETITDPNKGSDYVKLQAIYNGVATETFVNSLLGTTIIGASGVTAQVYHIEHLASTEPTTIYVRYTDSGTSGTVKTFSNNEVISTSDNTYSFQAATTGAVGKGSLATIKRGVYYINGHFCLVEEQVIALDKYSNEPSYRVGLLASQLIVTPESNETLLDNAQNSYNFAAPGAHRYSIDLTLTKLDIDSQEDQDFVELIRVLDGKVKTIVDNTEYSLLAQEFARRTYDESGDYTVRDFPIDIREYRDNNRGSWVKSTVYLTGDIITNPSGKTYVAKNSGTSSSIDNSYPTHTFGTVIDGTNGIYWEYNEKPYYNRGINKPPSQTAINAETIATQRANEAKLAVGLEAGKAYVQGYEIEKDSTTYVTVNKARDYATSTGAVVPATVGNYILVTNVNNSPVMEEFKQVTLYNRVTGSSGRGSVPSGAQIVGYARVRFMEWHDIQPFGSTSIYKMGLFDIQMNAGYDFARDVKSLYSTNSAGSSDANLAFSADISPISLSTNKCDGTLTAATSTTVTGTGTSFLSQLRVGDYINVAGSLYRVATITAAGTLTLDTALTASGATFYRAETQLQEPTGSSLIFPLPYPSIRSVRRNGDANTNYWPDLAASGTVDVTYQVYQKFTQTASGTTLTLSTSGTFASAAETDNYICINNDATDGGAVFVPTSITPSGSTCTINVGSSYSGRSITVIAAVIKTGAEKTKTLTQYTGIQSYNVFTSQQTVQQQVILLEHADIFRVKSVKMASTIAFGSTPTYAQYDTDISDRYDFDNGQRITHYDHGRLILKQSYAVPSNPIIVEYEYFEHGSGDYCSVNSYTTVATGSQAPDYKDIPSILRDSLDFRPKLANRTQGGSSRNFIGTGGSVSGIPKRGVDVTASFTYYLPRKDKIVLDLNGKFSSITGVPSMTPGEPSAPALGMVCYNLSYAPYTLDTSKDSIAVQKIENKRYTMRDIGKLEKRIDNLEYYTSLSLLETETQAMKIPDSTGMDRMKNGFVVDNFKSTTIGDTKSPDYVCSIDMAKGELRPYYTMYNSKLLEKNTLTSQRTSAGYQLNGDIITLPIIDTPVLIKQDYASRLENINPFAIFTFLGNTTINPPSDDWFETNRLADLINNVEGNYDSVRDAALKAGQITQNGLGTVWSAWQTEWVGKPVSSGVKTYRADRRYGDGGAWMDATFGIGPDAPGWAVRTVQTETIAQDIGQSRIGMQTSLVQKVDYQTVGDFTLSTAVIPFIRSRNVLVQSKGLKPSTRFWSYFDGVDISSYITPCAKLTYTYTGTNFDDSTNAGGNSNESKRRINGDSQVCLNRGDVITTSNGNSWAVVVEVSKEPQFDSNGNITGYKNVLDLANVNGDFTALINGQAATFTGSISGAQGTVVSYTAPTTLVSNVNGSVNFIFNIPNTDAAHFRTGSKELKLIDASTASGQWTSRGRAVYHAEGVLETKQTTINAVRNAELVREMVTDSKTVTTTTTNIVSDTGWYDPLAQSFLVEQTGGAFLTGIDIFFATKDDKIPVTLEIRECVNGVPGKNVLPFSRVSLKPEQVTLSSNTVTLPDGADYPSYDTPTQFKFQTPVYVQNGGEYAFVLQSDSNNYKVWISNMGDEIPGQPGRTISAQPYNGVMFKSQNASTWTPEQNQDIKFTIYRAQFDTSVTGTVDFVNDVTPYENLEVDPFQTVSGSTTVRVWQKDHGLADSSKVNIKGVAAAVNGIPAAELNGDHIVTNIDMDSYTFTTSTSATKTGYGGGSVVYATKNIQYDVMTPTVQVQDFSDTTTSYYVKTTSGKAIDGGQTMYTVDSYGVACLNKDNNFFTSPRVVASELNENTFMAGADSITFTVAMKSTNDSLSPVIDTARASLVLVNNKVNYPSETNVNVSALDYKSMFTGATGAFSFANIGTLWSANSTGITAGSQYYYDNNLYTVVQAGSFGGAAPIHTYGRAVNGTTILEYVGFSGSLQSTNSTIRNLLPNLAVGKYINVTGTTSNNARYLVTGYKDDGTTGIVSLNTKVTSENSVSGSTVQLGDLFIDDISPIGSSTYSSYVTSPVKLQLSSTSVRIRFAANIPAGSDVSVYYKTCVGESSKLKTTRYTLATPSGNGFVKVEMGDNTFYDVDFDLQNMTPFDNIVVKIVMKSTNSCAVPRIRDLRIIACA